VVNAIRSTTASAVARDGTQAINKNAVQAPQRIGGQLVVDNSQSGPVVSEFPDVGPAYEVEISEAGKELADNSGNPDKLNAATTDRQSQSQSEPAKKQQQDWRIRSEVAKFKQAEQNIRSHEAAHMSAGGAFAGGVSYVYAKGPDGKMYITGGEVPIQAPEGKTPEETVKNMEIVKRAALAPPDPSAQDLAVVAAAMQIESRARAAIRQGRFLTQADMEEGEPGTLRRPPVWPTSMAGLIATLMPPEGLSRR
jgi:hypothetical protein